MRETTWWADLKGTSVCRGFRGVACKGLQRCVFTQRSGTTGSLLASEKSGEVWVYAVRDAETDVAVQTGSRSAVLQLAMDGKAARGGERRRVEVARRELLGPSGADRCREPSKADQVSHGPDCAGRRRRRARCVPLQ